ncbi:MAG TPA: 30S ribosomal protein S18 [Phycisphaerales bacterium]|nr:30S ribosomal protein S18 [Phycisphaerales bacterium]HMP37561.1 30S ribosomal protein S18 [Phycisphaerales bacterium]
MPQSSGPHHGSRGGSRDSRDSRDGGFGGSYLGIPGGLSGGAPQPSEGRGKPSDAYSDFVDYKNVEELRRMMSANGKIFSRKRLNVTARGQKKIAAAIKRARFMALLPYTSATI